MTAATDFSGASPRSALRPARRRLPPLTALRALEAVGRHLSLSRAADELCVTPAAVSHQIRLLEDHLGVALLRRSGRTVALTEAGEACLPGIRDGFDRLTDALAQAENLAEGGCVTVSVTPSFASKWLVPRLGRFQQTHPGIDLRINASSGLANFQNDGVDLAIRYGSGRYGDLSVEPLMPESVFAVCSPALLARHPIATPADLASHVLLHDDSPNRDPSCPSWPMWLRAAGVSEQIAGGRGIRFTLSSLVVEAAVQGEGVALAKATLAQRDLEAGRLVRLFGGETPTDFAYFIVTPTRNRGLPKIETFIAWLHQETAI